MEMMDTPYEADSYAYDLSSVTFNSLPAYEEPGDMASTGEFANDMGYDPQRHWEARDRPADVFVLGDFESTFGMEQLSIDQISQMPGSDSN